MDLDTMTNNVLRNDYSLHDEDVYNKNTNGNNRKIRRKKKSKIKKFFKGLLKTIIISDQCNQTNMLFL